MVAIALLLGVCKAIHQLSLGGSVLKHSALLVWKREDAVRDAALVSVVVEVQSLLLSVSGWHLKQVELVVGLL